MAEDDVHDLAPGLPSRRGILAANMETAVNVVWDSRASIGDRVLVVGAGVVGLLVGYLMARIAGAEVTICDVNQSRRKIAETLGIGFCGPADAPDECDLAVNASASADGLTLALSCVGFEARVIEASWHGDAAVPLPLGEAFHSGRLQLVSSQVGQVPADRRVRWPRRRRMALAISLLGDPQFDHLITHEIAFEAAADELPPLFDDPSALAIALRYSTDI
ncbi:MAG: dehydrogenase [Methyloligellaceae bacterium]